MEDQRFSEAARGVYRRTVLDPNLVTLREIYCREVSGELSSIALWLGVDSWLGAVTAGAPRAEADAMQAVAAVIGMAEELASGVLACLDAGLRYSAGTLVRNLIETEYLLATFADDIAAASRWHDATPEDIRREFQPKAMRKVHGFSNREYWRHCEMGGHPTPQGRLLLRVQVQAPLDGDEFITASAWGDFAQHLRRVWRASRDVLDQHHPRFSTLRAAGIARITATEEAWTAADPLAEPINPELLTSLTDSADT